jgi:multicomponent K+:H+ antiporter subunit E/multicomponent Na+:H+ antiporter subunit E
MNRLGLAAALLLRFLWQVLASGYATARIVLRPGPLPAAGLIRMEFAPMGEGGAALLGALVTLTPGTTVIDIDLDRREMLLHVLDLAQADAAVASIRDDFERYVERLFPAPWRRP